MKLTIDVNNYATQRLRVMAQNLEKQQAFAASRALNAAAYAALEAGKKEMTHVFDRPTPWILRSIKYRKATKKNLNALVGFDLADPNKQGVTPSKVLDVEVTGGSRALKRFEKALQHIGILPQGMMVAPGWDAKLDQFGNMQAGEINQILSWFSAFGEQGYKANMTEKTRARRIKGTKEKAGFSYFVKPRIGIFKRVGHGSDSKVLAMMFFIPPPSYAPRFDFYGLLRKVAEQKFSEEFPKMLDAAMRTEK